jgi:glycerate kinase
MKVIVAPNFLKRKISTPEICSTIEEGFLRTNKEATIYKISLTNSGEITLLIIPQSIGSRLNKVKIQDTNKSFSILNYASSFTSGQIGFNAIISDNKRDLAFATENLIRAIQIGKKTSG